MSIVRDINEELQGILATVQALPDKSISVSTFGVEISIIEFMTIYVAYSCIEDGEIKSCVCGPYGLDTIRFDMIPGPLVVYVETDSDYNITITTDVGPLMFNVDTKRKYMYVFEVQDSGSILISSNEAGGSL